MTPAAKRYVRDLSFALAVYAIFLFGTRFALRAFEPPVGIAVILSLAPALGVVLMARAILIFSRSWDELQTRIVMEATVASASLVGFGSFAWGFLEGDVGAPRLPTIWIMPALFAVYGVAAFIVSRKYR